MAFHIRNPQTEALARKVAATKGVGLTEAVHEALANELKREAGKESLADFTKAFVRELKAKGDPSRARPADKAFIDSLYERD
ncbi:type II toxin-antitoxin system VapB family antitoxin [Mesorhizobium sp. LHD-90]|uniref:type II toxin-antitoxin system VapB family antitoxin n=1 Tax=Mesorhizobium sp. LHD-90 TaxID=3071414 RepID=UPI0027E1CC24|nr:type II toxin-antitoxin system VapB family antitoxin [Mesorhizobium sp. LHD-90]MDQ6434998.1 type II toxin-antitoxin system VapB family antitoxin [Mesorhizobium sp. LHD-90]